MLNSLCHRLGRNWIGATGRLILLSALFSLPLSLNAADGSFDNLTLTGTIDISGNALYLGNHVATPNTSGLLLGFTDGTLTTINFSATNNTNLWQWQQNGIGTPALQMSLTGSNTLTLYDSSSIAKITLNPLGTSTFVNSLTISGTDTQMPNQTLTGTYSVLTRGLADGRYLFPNGSGFVGIGTSSPGNKLQVGSGSGLASGAIGAFYGSGTTGGVVTIGASDASKQVEIGVDATAGFVTTISNQPIQFRPNSATAATILANGNFGIGTASPDSTFHAYGTSAPVGKFERYPTNASGTWTTITALADANSNTISDGFGPTQSFSIKNSSGTTFTIAVIGAVRETADNSGALLFQTMNNSGTPSERVRITHTGNVGIGTTTPSTKLEVNGGAKVSGAFTATGTATISGTVTAPAFMTTSAAGDIPMFGQ